MPENDRRDEQTRANVADDAPRRTREQRKDDAPEPRPREIGGVQGPEPTRYGDWERNGRCSDF